LRASGHWSRLSSKLRRLTGRGRRVCSPRPAVPPVKPARPGLAGHDHLINTRKSPIGRAAIGLALPGPAQIAVASRLDFPR